MDLLLKLISVLSGYFFSLSSSSLPVTENDGHAASRTISDNDVATITLQNNNNKDSTNKSLRQLPKGFYVLDPSVYRSRLGDDDYNWATEQVPFIDFPDDDDILTAYYYRWRMYKKHICWNDCTYTISEFLPNVSWAGKYNTIPAAAGHHIMEGRWLHNQIILDDYIRFWILNPDANPTSYTNWIGYATWQRYLLNGNKTFLRSIQEGLANLFRTRYVPMYLVNFTENDDDNNEYDPRDIPSSSYCWWQDDGRDAMEVSISGSGCRPTIASAMYGEALTQLKIAQLIIMEDDNDKDDDTKRVVGQDDIWQEFIYWLELSRSIVLNLHWNPKMDTFAVIPLSKSWTKRMRRRRKIINNSKSHHHHLRGDDMDHFDNDDDDGNYLYYNNNTSPSSTTTTCNLTNVRIPNKPVNVRELLAFMPWYFEGLIPTEVESHYYGMWKELLSSSKGGFAANYGLRTAERRHECYNYSYTHGDCWNGPSWPYETSRVMTALAQILQSKNNHDEKNNKESEQQQQQHHGSFRRGGSAHNNNNVNNTQKADSSSFPLSIYDYWFLIQQYAQQHTRTFAMNDTAKPLGSGHVFENLHPDLGYWNNRARNYWFNNSGTKLRDMGDDYNHSTFCDLILSGLLGIRPRGRNDDDDATMITIHPLIPPDLIRQFAVDHVRVQGDNNILSITWCRKDYDDCSYANKGLTVFLNGKVVAHRETMGRLDVVVTPDDASSSTKTRT